MPEPSELLDVASAAAFLSTTESHIRALVFRRELAFVKVGRLVRLRVADLEEYIANRTIRAER